MAKTSIDEQIKRADEQIKKIENQIVTLNEKLLAEKKKRNDLLNKKADGWAREIALEIKKAKGAFDVETKEGIITAIRNSSK